MRFDWIPEILYEYGMYWTPAWGIVLASVTGIVSVLGTVGGVVLTLRHSRKESEADRAAANIRHQRELRERHAERQRTALSDLFLHYLEFTNRISSLADDLQLISDKHENGKLEHAEKLRQSFDKYSKSFSRFRVASDSVRIVAKDASYIKNIDSLDDKILNYNNFLYAECDRLFEHDYSVLDMDLFEAGANQAADLYRELVEAAGEHIEAMLTAES